MGNTKWKVHHNKKKTSLGWLLFVPIQKHISKFLNLSIIPTTLLGGFLGVLKKFVHARERKRIVSPLETHQERVENGCAQLVLISWAPWGANHPQIKQLDIPA